MKNDNDPSEHAEVENRRSFLKGGMFAGIAAISAPVAAQSSQQSDTSGPTQPACVEADPDPTFQSDSGSDYMVDVLKALNIDFAAINSSSSVRGLQESIVNYGGNKPELLTVLHEEIGVAMAQGYAKIAGKPMAVLAHGTVGLQHASMGLYNAYCDQVPVVMLIGNALDVQKRGLAVDWQHTAQDPAAMVRDFLKWDDQPASLVHFGESAVRAYQMAMTPPQAPVLLSVDQDLQENPLPGGVKPPVKRLSKIAPVAADSAAMLEVAKLLVAADNPVLVAERLARTQAGMDSLVELAELLQCAVIDRNARTNFPNLHPLNQTMRFSMGDADLIVGLEVSSFWSLLNTQADRIARRETRTARADVKTVHITAKALFMHANYQEFGRFESVDLLVPADAESSLPSLIEACKRLITAKDRSRFKARGARLAEASRAAREVLKQRASIGWNGSPVTGARLCAEVYAQIKHEDWSLVGQGFHAPWQKWLWDADKTYRFNGFSGGWGLGYNLPGSLGGALANKAHGRLSVALQGDGDFMYCPSTLWTAAHHRIPILYVMHNNRSYHQEIMHIQKLASRRNRGIRPESVNIANVITDPDIDFATLAKSMGVYGEGPIENPADIAPALKRAIAMVKQGLPALVDIICDGSRS
ncbi:thiamine pyrophosphate-binding protein [Steroidobacter agaridevorans]|uniref:Thiamine pyrophosphate-binding protein n=1 Tax=Steroidobacter agaridevorans TaxID=2695856 RepID=A0A829YAP7_9GAMM|nr:thiamine pyrophosphate-dependent enzyme [Steroidobacter agaridevorans]GFE80145.1 thiamine pyrophosphate-binding protein [Steroidobacter agaridevorans]GFE89885.1 thiamine pyrophosphate-binding protein [Steroidobacter agaridevorans]